MKKLFISCPMKGRTEEAIKESMKKMHKIAEAVFEEELEPIDSFIHKKPQSKNSRIAYLAESLKLMADADYFIGAYSENDGCSIERGTAIRYDLPHFFVEEKFIMPKEELSKVSPY